MADDISVHHISPLGSHAIGLLASTCKKIKGTHPVHIEDLRFWPSANLQLSVLWFFMHVLGFGIDRFAQLARP